MKHVNQLFVQCLFGCSTFKVRVCCSLTRSSHAQWTRVAAGSGGRPCRSGGRGQWGWVGASWPPKQDLHYSPSWLCPYANHRHIWWTHQVLRHIVLHFFFFPFLSRCNPKPPWHQLPSAMTQQAPRSFTITAVAAVGFVWSEVSVARWTILNVKTQCGCRQPE